MFSPKQSRITLNLTKPQMAKAMGVSQGSWKKWESKEQGITAAPIRLIQTLLWLKEKNLFDDFLNEVCGGK